MLSKLQTSARQSLDWLRRPWRLGLPRGHYLAFLLLFGFCAHVYATQELRKYSTANVVAHGDGRYYYAYLRSLALDFDTNFENDYRILGNHYGFPKNKRTGRRENKFTIGPALYWAPFLVTAHGGLALGNALGWTDDSLDGTSPRYQRVVFFGSLFWAFAAVLVFFAAARRFTTVGSSVVAAWSTLLATPLLWFALRQPSFSHTVSAFSVGFFVLYWLHTLGKRTRRQWALLGALLGLAALVRPQNLGHALLPFCEWISAAILCAHARDWRALRDKVLEGLLFAAGSVVAFTPQLIAWTMIYGSPFTIPQGNDFMHWVNSRWEAVLFSSRAGLFAWHPLIYLGVIGVLILLVTAKKTDGEGPPRRLVAIAILLAFASQVYLNGAAWDWYGGWAFGGRRFLSCSVYFAIGLAIALEAIVRALSRVKRGLVAAVPVTLCGVFMVLNLGLMDGYLKYKVRHGAEQEMGPVWQHVIGKSFRKVYDKVGNLGSIPANWIFALRTDGSPGDYDLASGRQVLDGAAQTLSFADKGFTFGGFGKPVHVAGQRARLLTKPSGTFVLGLRDRKGITAAITLAPTGTSSKVRISLRGKTLLEQEVRNGWSTHLFYAPKILMSTGLNYFHVEQTSAPRAPLAIGSTGTISGAEFSITSAGYKSGRRVIASAGTTRIDSKQRGIQLFVVNEELNKLESRGVFDTFGRGGETKRLKRVLERLDKGTIVMLGVADEASRKWSQEGDAALRLVGGKTTLLKRWRCSYALIGVRGAQPGSAMEKLDCDKKASLRVGRVFGQRHRGVAFSKLLLRTIEP